MVTDLIERVRGLTEADREILDDKLTLWTQWSHEGNMEMRDYHGRCAKAMSAVLQIVDAAAILTALQEGR